MSLLHDVRSDLHALDCSETGLVKFGRTVGGVFLLIATIVYIVRDITPAMIVCATVGSLLAIASLTAPMMLRQIYKVWMAVAFVLGWIVSRVILALFFFVIITPVAVAARIAGKKFLNTDFKTGQQSYWIAKEHRAQYDKMS